MGERWRRAGADQADVRFWPRQSQRHRKCSDRIAGKGHRICWPEAFSPCAVPCLRLRYRAAALPSQGHAACAQDEMTMAAATHALPALQRQQSRKLSSRTPQANTAESPLEQTAVAPCSRCLTSLHTPAPTAPPLLVSCRPLHSSPHTPCVAPQTSKQPTAMTTSPHPAHCALDPNLPHPAAVDCGTKTSCRLAPPSPHHERSVPASIRCCPVIRFNNPTCHRELHVENKLWKRKAID
jgi:hypothetical protein